jgi:uncharacterized membrane protein YeiB
VLKSSVNSRIPGSTATNGSFSIKSQSIGVAIPGRILGYDVARAIAVIGMVIVNYHNIFLVGRSHHPQWFTGLAGFLLGRAAAVFVMLAGVGITLMSHKAIISGDTFLIKKVRKGLLKRSLVLFLMGLVFLNWWGADILHFYGLFLSAASLLLFVPGRRIWLLIGGCLIVAGSLFIFYEADPILTQILLPANKLFELCDEMLISGQYPMLPWFSFLLVGMWLGRPEIISNRKLIRRIFWTSVLVFLLTIVLDYLSNVIIFQFPDIEEDSPLALMLLSVPFPISPFFFFFFMAGSLVVIIFCISLSSQPLLAKPFTRLGAIGKMSLTVYIGHIFIGLAVDRIVFPRLNLAEYQIFTVAFTLLFCLTVFWNANLWFRHFEIGPLEWTLRRLSQYL